jgi:hypothetical protein
MENNASQQTPNDVELSLKLNLNDVNVVITGLRELPHRISDEVLRKVVTQAQSQAQAAQQNGQGGYQSPPPAFYSKQ